MQIILKRKHVWLRASEVIKEGRTALYSVDEWIAIEKIIDFSRFTSKDDTIFGIAEADIMLDPVEYELLTRKP